MVENSDSYPRHIVHKRGGGDVRAFTPWEIEGRKREGILVHYLEKPRGYHGEWSLLHLGQQLL